MPTVREPSRELPAAAPRPPEHQREVLSSWIDSPCPVCASPLRYASERPIGQDKVAILLRCASGHCWDEELSLRTMHSGVFVLRRSDLERQQVEAPAVADPAHAADDRLRAAVREALQRQPRIDRGWLRKLLAVDRAS